MYQFKGFVEIETLISNVSNQVAAIGELSSHCQTYSKDKLIFNDPSNRSTSLINFCSKSTNSGTVSVPISISTMGLSISNWIYQRQMALTSVETKDTFVNALVTNFIGTCDNLNCGEMKTASNGRSFPEWVTWKNRNYLTEDNINKIWFSDSSFRQQYDEYEIVVIPPFPTIDFFFNAASAITKELATRSYSKTLDAVGLARGEYPETVLTSESFDWVNPFNPTDKINTDWSVLIYGPKGNNYDLIVNAVYDYIVKYSVRPADDWKLIFPDIFKRTEFVILPKWHSYSIPNMTLQAGIYSSVINLKKELEYLKRVLPDYPSVHIDNHATVLPNPYKNIILDVIGGVNNRENLFEITQIFPDIISVSNTSNDFSRMKYETQGFLNLLAKLIIAAEKMTLFTDVPIGLRRTVRNNVIYIGASYLKVQYLMACKESTPV